MIWPFLLAAIYPSLYNGEDVAKFTSVAAPGVRYRMNMAMATSAPWVDSNLWKYRRKPDAAYLTDARQKSVALAVAEGFLRQVKLTVRVADTQKAEYEEILAFLKSVPEGPKTPWVNLAIEDDGSAVAGEALNLMARRNLLYASNVKAPVNMALSSKSKPYDAMQEARERVGDDNRILRIYGSELTLAELTREGNRIRLQLLNYGSRPVESLRIRLKGKFTPAQVKARIFKVAEPDFVDWAWDGEYTEFTLSQLPLYGVLDITA